MTKEKIRRDPKEVFDLIIKELTKKEIRKKLGLSTTALANHLERLELEGYIKREGKYVIEVLKSSYLYPKVTRNRVNRKLNKRGHAYNFKIIFSEERDLRRKDFVRNELKKGKIKKLGFGSFKLTKNKNTIWINKESLTIYSSNSYYSKNALHDKFAALRDVDKLARDMQRRFDFKGIYGIEIFREHYGLIFNKFAEWCLGKGKKLYVKDKGNKAILWVDDSRKDDIGLKEFEGKDPRTINNADTFFKSHEEHNFKHDADFIDKGFDNTNKAIIESSHQIKFLAENQIQQGKDIKEFASQIRTHIPAYKKMGDFTEALFHEIKGLKEEIKQINNKK